MIKSFTRKIIARPGKLWAEGIRQVRTDPMRLHKEINQIFGQGLVMYCLNVNADITDPKRPEKLAVERVRNSVHFKNYSRLLLVHTLTDCPY